MDDLGDMKEIIINNVVEFYQKHSENPSRCVTIPLKSVPICFKLINGTILQHSNSFMETNYTISSEEGLREYLSGILRY
tara:strand:- start:1062 stop:1298 length:237 start_codon:yes stop_codon:yes gene_type:complete